MLTEFDEVTSQNFTDAELNVLKPDRQTVVATCGG